VNLHFEMPELGVTYESLLAGMAREGFTHVSLVTQWAQGDVHSAEVRPHPTETPPDETLRRALRAARAVGLRALVFPILWLERSRAGEWRGALRPRDRGAWWRAYERFTLHYAHIAAQEGAWGLSVGSELSSMEGDEGRWRALIAAARARFSGRLLYSANWDHAERVPFWDAVDHIGVTGYHPLSSAPDPSVEELTAAWGRARDTLGRWLDRAHPGRPLLITELGYPSLRGAAARPWDYTPDRPVDLEAQRRPLEAFRRAWRGEARLEGAFVWSWWGLGGPHDGWYTVRNKPALREVRAWLRAERARAGLPPPPAALALERPAQP